MNRHWPLPSWHRMGYNDCLQFYAGMFAAAGTSEKAINDTKRFLASNDLFFLLCFVLRRPDMAHPYFFARCREVQEEPNGRLDLWAREHGKSTIITFAGTIFEIIQNPEVTIGIFSHTKPVAKKFLIQIKTELEQNELLPQLWPEIFWPEPKKQAEKWSEDGGLIVIRSGNPKEATIEAHGLVDGQPTGRHFMGMVYDDVVTIESVSTAEQISKTTYSFRMSDNLGARGGWKRYIGTRYHLFDTYHTMIQDEIAVPRLRPATHNGMIDGNPVLLSDEELAAKRRTQGPYVFSSQMLLDPTADRAMGFDLRWLVYGDTDYTSAMRSLWRFIIVDPAGSKQRKNNDFTTFWVLGFGADGKFRVLDIVRDRLNLTGRTNKLFELHEKWKPELVAYEEYGMQADIEHIKFVQKTKLYEFDIHPVGGSMPKPLRILRLVPYFENGFQDGDTEGKSRIILPTSISYLDYQGIRRDLVKDFIEHEFTAFPVLDHDDMLDCLARIIDLEQMGLIQKPTITPPKVHGVGIRDGLKKAGSSGGSESWITA